MILDPKISILTRRTVIILSLIYILWDSMAHGSVVSRSASILECVMYCGMMPPMVQRRIPETWTAMILVAMVIITVILGLTLYHDQVWMSLFFYIIGISGARLGEPLTWWTGGFTVAATLFMLMVLKPLGPLLSAPYAGYLAGMLGVYVGTRNAGLRRRARAAQEQYLAELEQAHHALQVAHKDLQEVSIQSMQLAVVEERNRIAREIHDSVGHSLTSLIVQLQALQFRVRRDVSGAEQQIKDLVVFTRQSLDEVRRSVRDIADASPISGVHAMSALVDGVRANSGLHIAFDAAGDLDNMPLETGAVLYRILQETLTNVVRHSGASEVAVRLERQDSSGFRFVRLHVEDNGHASASSPIQEGFGFRGMKSRCQDFGGTFTWQMIQPHGLSIEALVPWQKTVIEEEHRYAVR